MKRTLPDDLSNDCEEWMKKCFECKHCFMYINSVYWYCSLRKIECTFEPRRGETE